MLIGPDGCRPPSSLALVLQLLDLEQMVCGPFATGSKALAVHRFDCINMQRARRIRHGFRAGDEVLLLLRHWCCQGAYLVGA